jgi:CPA1 family monovalent cation:H+ antiporter
LRAGLASFAHDRSAVADLVRRDFATRLTPQGARADGSNGVSSTHLRIHRRAIQAAREAVIAMRANEEIGDDAFHRIEQELDWLEMASTRGRE